MLQSYLPSKDAFFVGGTRAGSLTMGLPLMLPSMILGFMIANVVAWCIPFLRNSSNEAAKGDKYMSFKWNMFMFSTALAVLLLFMLPISLLGAANIFSLSQRGIDYHPLLSIATQQFAWSDIKEVHYWCDLTHGSKRGPTPYYNHEFIFKDGTAIEVSNESTVSLLEQYKLVQPFLSPNPQIAYRSTLREECLQDLLLNVQADGFDPEDVKQVISRN